MSGFVDHVSGGQSQSPCYCASCMNHSRELTSAWGSAKRERERGRVDARRELEVYLGRLGMGREEAEATSLRAIPKEKP